MIQVMSEQGRQEKPLWKGLYVAGDARTKKLRQVVTAVSDGANAATAVAEYLK